MRKTVIPLLKYQRSLETVDWPHPGATFHPAFFLLFDQSSFFFLVSVERNSPAVWAKSFADENQLKG